MNMINYSFEDEPQELFGGDEPEDLFRDDSETGWYFMGEFVHPYRPGSEWHTNLWQTPDGPTDEEVQTYSLNAVDPENRRFNWDEWRAHKISDARS